MDDLQKIFSAQRAIKREAETRSVLLSVKRSLEKELERIRESVKVEYSGWYVLLAKDGDGFRFLSLFNPDTFDEATETEPEWEFAIPIPTPDTYPEFQGW